jgi:hypothetical protein
MAQTESEFSIETYTTLAAAEWRQCSLRSLPAGRHYSPREQQKHEKAYDAAQRQVERAMKRAPRNRSQRLATQDRILDAFAEFSATALDLPDEAVQLITRDFLPVGTALARWAHLFDPALTMAEIVQACRNAWTVCGLQPLLGERAQITPAIVGYSLLYPYSDNFLDRGDLSTFEKLRFSSRFRQRLQGHEIAPLNELEAAVWALIALIEGQYSRLVYPQVYACLLAIHQAQEESIAQLSPDCSDEDLLRLSCAKGGSSTATDGCLVRGWLLPDEFRFSFDWGALLQLGDDLQDVREDLQRASATLFTRAIHQGRPLDSLVAQLLNFSQSVSNRMDHLADGNQTLRELLKMSWQSLIIGAVAEIPAFFSPAGLAELERRSPFRFHFLRQRNQRLKSTRGLYTILFAALLESRTNSEGQLPSAIGLRTAAVECLV